MERGEGVVKGQEVLRSPSPHPFHVSALLPLRPQQPWDDMDSTTPCEVRSLPPRSFALQLTSRRSFVHACGEGDAQVGYQEGSSLLLIRPENGPDGWERVRNDWGGMR